MRTVWQPVSAVSVILLLWFTFHKRPNKQVCWQNYSGEKQEAAKKSLNSHSERRKLLLMVWSLKMPWLVPQDPPHRRQEPAPCTWHSAVTPGIFTVLFWQLSRKCLFFHRTVFLNPYIEKYCYMLFQYSPCFCWSWYLEADDVVTRTSPLQRFLQYQRLAQPLLFLNRFSVPKKES